MLVRGLVAGNAARAGLEYAMTRVPLTDPRLQWRPDGRAYRWQYGDAEVEVKIVDENGKIDLNQADMPLLAALIQQRRRRAMRRPRASPAAIIDWRDPDPLTQPAGGARGRRLRQSAGLPYGAKDADFESVAELEQVMGITPEAVREAGAAPDRLQRPRPSGSRVCLGRSAGCDGA